MADVRVDISMSLDGYVAGPGPRSEAPLGDGGERLHEWAYKLRSFQAMHGRDGGEEGPDDDQLAAASKGVGAGVMGRGMFGGGHGPWDKSWEGWWGDDPPFRWPIFVVTHHEREPLTLGDTTFTFVTGGVRSALEQASAAAGKQDVSVSGGANVIQQCLQAEAVDRLTIHLVPILLGGGVRLFDRHPPAALEIADVVASPGVTHLAYRRAA